MESKIKDVPTCDDALIFVGGFGLYQLIVISLLSILTLPTTYQFFIMYFVGFNPPWVCINNSTNCTFTDAIKSTDKDRYNYRCKIDRSQWKYVEDKEFSIVTDFELNCERNYLIFIASSMFFFAMFISSLPIGWFSDRFGRQKCLAISTTIFSIVSTLSSFAPNYFWFTLSRFITGFFAPGTTPLFAIIASEITLPKHRPLFVIIIWFFFALALILMGVLAMYVRQWKYIMLYSTAPYLIFLPIVFFIPESLRWLHAKGKLIEANRSLQRIAQVNGKNEIVSLSPLKLADIKLSPLTLFRTKKSTLKTLNIAAAWLVNSLVYFGITLATSNLSGEIYRDYILVSLVEFPAAVLGIYLASKIGRKVTVQGPMIIGGVICALISIIHESDPNQNLRNLRIALGIIGKFCLTLSFDVIYTWTIELYPTQIRSQAMSFAQLMARLGGTIAPWVALWLNKWHWRIPFILMGSIAVVSALFLFLLPETKYLKTAEVLNDCEDDNKHEILENNSFVAFNE